MCADLHLRRSTRRSARCARTRTPGRSCEAARGRTEEIGLVGAPTGSGELTRAPTGSGELNSRASRAPTRVRFARTLLHDPVLRYIVRSLRTIYRRYTHALF